MEKIRIIIVLPFLFSLTIFFAETTFSQQIYNGPSNSSLELIHVFDFDSQWTTWHEDGANVSVRTSSSGASIFVQYSTGQFSDIQLFYNKLSLVENQKYSLSLSAYASKGCMILSKYHDYIPGVTDENLQTPQYSTFNLVKGNNNINATFKGLKTVNNGRFTIYFGRVPSGTELTINGIALYAID